MLTSIRPYHASHLCPSGPGLGQPSNHVSNRQNVLALAGEQVRQVPVRQALRCTTTTPQRDTRVYVEGTWCESHTMAPAVCISNPSNGTHNCRPGWRTCWVQLPSAAHRSTHALARSHPGHTGRRRFLVYTRAWYMTTVCPHQRHRGYIPYKNFDTLVRYQSRY